MKKLQTYISLILGMAISFFLAAPAFADDVVEDIKNKGTCYDFETKMEGEKDINGTSILSQLATGQMITTEVEEGFANAGAYGESIVRNCFRVTACKEGDKTMCVSFVNKECGIEEKQGTVKTAGSPVNVAVTNCEKVQLIISKAGTGLLYTYIGMVYRWAASIVGVIAVLIIVVSGIQISAAGGDPGKVDEAKGRIIRALAGLAVLFMSGLILYTINPTFFVT